MDFTRVLRARDQSGVTLVELLVVLILLGVVGGVVTTAIVTSLRAASATTARVTALNELEVAMQRMTRDLRVAEAFIMSDTTDFASEITAAIFRGGSESTVTYAVVDSGDRRALVREDTGQTLVTLVDNESDNVFTYLDAAGVEISCSGPSDCAERNQTATQVRIRLVRTIEGRSPVVLESTVNVRNTRYVGGTI